MATMENRRLTSVARRLGSLWVEVDDVRVELTRQLAAMPVRERESDAAQAKAAQVDELRRVTKALLRVRDNLDSIAW